MYELSTPHGRYYCKSVPTCNRSVNLSPGQSISDDNASLHQRYKVGVGTEQSSQSELVRIAGNSLNCNKINLSLGGLNSAINRLYSKKVKGVDLILSDFVEISLDQSN